MQTLRCSPCAHRNLPDRNSSPACPQSKPSTDEAHDSGPVLSLFTWESLCRTTQLVRGGGELLLSKGKGAYDYGFVYPYAGVLASVQKISLLSLSLSLKNTHTCTHTHTHCKMYYIIIQAIKSNILLSICD